MIELTLIVIYLVTLYLIYKKFRHIIKAMSEIDQILSLLDNDNNQAASLDEVDTPEEGVIQCKKRGVLKDAIKQGKAHLLGGNKKLWTVEQLDKAKDEVINKLYVNYTQREIKFKAENTGNAMGKHIVNLYSNGVDKLLKIDDLEQLKKDINDDPIIKDSMADIGALMLVTFGKWLSPMLIACHTANHVKWERAQMKKNLEEEDQNHSIKPREKSSS